MKSNKFNLPILGLVTLFAIIGCTSELVHDDPGYAPNPGKRYIRDYVHIENMSIRALKGMEVGDGYFDIDLSSGILPNETAVGVDEDITLHISNFDYRYNQYTEINAAKYSQIIGDTVFDRIESHGIAGWPIAIIDTIDSFVVTCDKDYSANYPMGSKLNDLFTMYFEYPYLVVKNNYTQPKKGYRLKRKGAYENYPHVIIGESLGTITFKDKPFIGEIWFLKLNESPEITDEYIFTVKIKTVDGKEIEIESQPLNIKGIE